MTFKLRLELSSPTPHPHLPPTHSHEKTRRQNSRNTQSNVAGVSGQREGVEARSPGLIQRQRPVHTRHCRAREEVEFALRVGGKLHDLKSVFQKIPLLTLWRMNYGEAEVQIDKYYREG